MRTMAPPGRPVVTAALLATLIALGCSSTLPSSSPHPSPSSAPSSSPSPIPTATPGGGLSSAQLRYLLLDQFSPISWCDPDFYPIAHQDEQVSADEHWPEIIADTETIAAIANRLGVEPDPDLDAPGRLAVYREWKLLNAVGLQPLDGTFAFDLVTETDAGLGKGIRSAGTIDSQGTIELALQEDAFLVGCPICLARGTLIDTPNGPLAVEDLSVGDTVWTLDARGNRVARPLLRVGSSAVPAGHRMVDLVLDDGRRVLASAGHPTADGRSMGDLRMGDRVDGALVVSARRVTYGERRTFDILPDGGTGTYWANGILLGSTLGAR